MSKKFFFSFIIGCLTTNVFAQVQIQTTLPTVGLVQKNQLWNLVLVNSTGNAVTARLEMVLFDRQTAQELMTATTAEFQLPHGPLAINVNKLNPIQYNYIGIEPDKKLNSLLPVGAYSVCYSLSQTFGGEKKTLLAEECVAFDIEPLSPPMLTFPADSSVLETAPTQFGWTPPTPTALLNQLHYEVVITEIQPSQKAAEAIAENSPFFSTDRPVNNFLNYSAALPTFEKEKWYAWQVIARDNSNYAGRSEVWVFKIAQPSPLQQALTGQSYVKLQKSGAEKTIAPNGNLRFYYFNQLGDKEVTVTISDIADKGKAEVTPFVLPVERGENFIHQDLSRKIKMQEGHVYMLSLENSAKEKWYVMFEVKKYKN